MENKIQSLDPPLVWRYFYELTQIPRPTGHMSLVREYILGIAREFKLESRVDAVGNVLISKPASAGYEDRAPLVLQSHLDMVGQKTLTSSHNFARDPLSVYIDGEWVRARETTLGADNGIGVALMLAIISDNTLAHCPLELLFTIDEEVGMVGALGLDPGLLKGRTLINCDSEEEGVLFVGCAGGIDLNISFQYKKGSPLIEGDVPVRIMLSNLKGGHSGIDIHLGRANANKLMFRFLKEAVRDYGVRLATIRGGSARNAIPRECEVVVTLPDSNVEALWEFIADTRELWLQEYRGIEPDLCFTAEMTSAPISLIPQELQDDLINAMEGCRDGVMSMLPDFPDTVETSSNLAIVESTNGRIDLKILARSASESRKEWISSSLESIFSLAGAQVEYGGAYSGWQPDINSDILRTLRTVYHNLYGRYPGVKVVHAGLECGIIQESYPDMKMISLGPDLVCPHSPDEAVRISSVRRVWDFLIKSLSCYGSGI